jgi:H+/gluconate symporter-like permease
MRHLAVLLTTAVPVAIGPVLPEPEQMDNTGSGSLAAPIAAGVVVALLLAAAAVLFARRYVRRRRIHAAASDEPPDNPILLS